MITVLKDKIEGTFIGAREQEKGEVGVERRKGWESREGREAERGRGTRGQSHTYVDQKA